LGYTHREIFSILYIAVAFWPFLSGSQFVIENMVLISIWVVSCFGMSAFTFLPVIKVESVVLM
jgi:phosphatidylinositol glycan class N